VFSTLFSGGSKRRRVACRADVHPSNRDGNFPPRLTVVVKLAFLWGLLCSIPLVRARGDVNLATWSKPGQGIEVWGAATDDRLGIVAGAGDVNKDGYHDILVGAYAADISAKANAGAVYLVFGSPGRSTSVVDTASTISPKGIKISGAVASDNWGLALSGAGDVNKDGIDDFIIGGFRYDPSSRTDAGAAVVIFGKTSGWGTST
jgi:hypothetical protein